MRNFRTISPEVALSITTGVLLCDFSALHEAIEFIAGGPVWTHQIPRVGKECRAQLLRWHPILKDIDASGVTTDSYQVWLAEQKEHLNIKEFVVWRADEFVAKINPIEELEAMIAPGRSEK
jgi:hypothetical protein